jgi:hypothetical protein
MTTGKTAWELERDERMAAAQREQELAHERDPYRVPKYLPVDHPEFGTEAYTADWRQEPGA